MRRTRKKKGRSTRRTRWKKFEEDKNEERRSSRRIRRKKCEKENNMQEEN